MTRTGWGTVESLSLSDTRAQVLLHSWDAEGVILISEDEESGALSVEPEAYSARLGVTGCRYNLSGMDEGLRLVTSIFQGIDMAPDDPALRTRYFRWPFQWEASLAISTTVGNAAFGYTPRI